nr:MAG TPA: hypothetical protein [Caudoviricetes sp.]
MLQNVITTRRKINGNNNWNISNDINNSNIYYNRYWVIK